MIDYLWRVSKGYRLRPWKNPYLLWRIETYSGIPAGQIDFSRFWSFVWRHRRDLWRFLHWAERMAR